MERRIKVGLTLIVIGLLVLFLGYTLSNDFREKEEENDRGEEEDSLTEHGGILALNFCGGVFLISGAVAIFLKIFNIDFTAGKEN